MFPWRGYSTSCHHPQDRNRKNLQVTRVFVIHNFSSNAYEWYAGKGHSSYSILNIFDLSVVRISIWAHDTKWDKNASLLCTSGVEILIFFTKAPTLIHNAWMPIETLITRQFKVRITPNLHNPYNGNRVRRTSTNNEWFLLSNQQLSLLICKQIYEPN